MDIKSFFDQETFTLTYVVFDERTKDAVIIDPVLDYDPAGGKISRQSIKKIIDFVSEHALRVHFVLETHAHADHLSGAQQLVKEYFPEAKIAIGERITEVQKIFKSIFNFGSWFKTDGSQFHRLFKDNEEISAGSLRFKVIFTPGHTPACVSYLFEDAVFTGDALFLPDYGTGRCDFPSGDARALYNSVFVRLYSLPDSTKVYVGHDYQPNGRALAFETTIGASKKENIQLKGSTQESDFVNFRNQRDSKLSAPRLLFPSVQFNISAGNLPEPETDGKIYFKIPITQSK